MDEIAVKPVADGACMPARRTAVAARRLIAPDGRASLRIAAEVIAVGVDDVTSIERMVTAGALPAAGITNRACAGEAKRHSVSASSMRCT